MEFAAREHTVSVWGRDVMVSVHQKSKSVWIARASYLGEHIEVKGGSAKAALALWQDAARYKGN